MVNIVYLLGRSTKKLELKTTSTGKVLCDFSLAVDGYGNTVDFINCQVWGKGAEYLTKYGKKGSIISVEGNIKTQNYADKNGNQVYKTFILANQVKLIGGKNEATQNTDGENPFANQEEVKNPFATKEEVKDPFSEDNHFRVTEEDIPF